MNLTQPSNTPKNWYVTLILALTMSVTIGCSRRTQNDPETSAGMAGSEMSAEPNMPNDGTPTVMTEPTYSVLEDLELTYAEGLAHDETSATPRATPLKLDVYYPDAPLERRPVFMFIHGGGFTGGTKTKPEIVEMARYYASRGWVFASIDYRTTEELCDSERAPSCKDKLQAMSQEELIAFYEGVAPREWIELALEGSESIKNLQQAIAMYAAQRDAKASLRWLVAHSDRYNINTDYITVGGASAGAITTVALGISDQSDFRDELSVAEDPTLSTTNLNETYTVQSLVYFWGSNVKLELFEQVYGVSRYDRDDPELFMAHGTDDQNPTTTFEEATELKAIYDDLDLHSELVPLEGQRHGAWGAQVDGKSLSALTFDFLVERQSLDVSF